jgi:lipopolysaccharide transport system ATP-binding protein
MSVAIKVENLSKQYQLRHQKQQRYVALRDIITDKAMGAWKGIREFGKAKSISADLTRETFWALKDINLEIEQGDRIGIIGRNGAGKSTLLKLLSRIIEPTAGKISINGRISSLLEVGTGFHPELTGRENVYLNGAILGMRHHEIKRKFDEIVAFADVEKFLDTPVKHYSSGMYMRLAFSVAAHLDPEILVVDEVLAVGDAQFQKKCLGKMKEVGSEGRTILFVSHNMNAIEQLCTKGIALDKGIVTANTSDMRALIKGYLFDANLQNSNKWVNDGTEYSNPWFRPISFSITDENANLLSSPVPNNKEIWVQIEAEIQEIDPALTMGYAIYSEDGNLIYWSYQTDAPEENWPKLKKGMSLWRTKIPARYLNEGSYRLEVIGGLHFREWICEPGVQTPSIEFQISGGLSDSPFWHAKRPGVLAPVMNWEITT